MKWTEQAITNEIYNLMNKLGIDRMPTSTEMRQNRMTGLMRAITISGGMQVWVDKLNLKAKEKEKLWTDELIKEQIFSSMKTCCIKRMPTASELVSIGRNDLHCALSKSELKYSGWAKKLNLELKSSETTKGNEYELLVKKKIELLYKNLTVEKMSTKHPYDLLINGCAKVDVKVSAPHNHFGPRAHTFALNKKYATCDIYVCVALDETERIEKFFVIPAAHVQIVTLNIGTDSKYNKYINQWDFIDRFVNRYEEAINI